MEPGADVYAPFAEHSCQLSQSIQGQLRDRTPL